MLDPVPHRRSLLPLLLTALAACASSASPPDLASNSAPLQGGSLDATDRATVGLTAWRAGRAFICSGVLVSPNVVLAARHCITTQLITTVTCGSTPLGPSLSPDQLTVTTSVSADNSLPDDGGADRTVSSISVVPGADDTCGSDLAFLVLSTPIPASEAPPYVPRFSPPVSGERYSAVGFGETCADASNELCYLESGQRRRRDGLAVSCVDGCLRATIATTEWGGDTGLCLGDSGGAALDEQGRLLGVALRGDVDSVGNCTAPVYSLLSSWEADIRAIVTMSAAQAGIPAPSWADHADAGGDQDAGDATVDVDAALAEDADSAAAALPDGRQTSGCTCGIAHTGRTSLAEVFLVAVALLAPTHRRRGTV
jgi:hypothetical protein